MKRGKVGEGWACRCTGPLRSPGTPLSAYISEPLDLQVGEPPELECYNHSAITHPQPPPMLHKTARMPQRLHLDNLAPSNGGTSCAAQPHQVKQVIG